MLILIYYAPKSWIMFILLVILSKKYAGIPVFLGTSETSQTCQKLSFAHSDSKDSSRIFLESTFFTCIWLPTSKTLGVILTLSSH